MEKLDLQVHVDPFSARRASLSPQSGWRGGVAEPLCQEVFSHLKILSIAIKQPCPPEPLISYV